MTEATVQEKIYETTRVVPRGTGTTAPERLAVDVTLQRRVDGGLDVTHHGQTQTFTGTKVDNWLRRAELDEGLQPLADESANTV